MSYLCRFTSGIISLPFHNNLTVDPASQPRPHCSFCANKRALWCCFALYTNIFHRSRRRRIVSCFLRRRAIWILYDTISQYFHAEIYVCSFYNQLLRPLCLCPLVLLFSSRQHYIIIIGADKPHPPTACISGSGVNEMKDGPFHCLPATTCSGCFSAPYGPW